jgi:transketolase
MEATASSTEGHSETSHREMANAIRALAMDAVEKAKSGHPGMPMGMADVATVLFTRFLKFDPGRPHWPDRDRFVLSAGHGSMLLYALLHLTGYEQVTLDELKRFRQVGAITAGHPEFGHCVGVETTTGPLGQGLATAVGMALAERMLASRFSSQLVDHYTYVIVGDGCLMEGISHEAIDLAGHLGLSRLIVLFDDNGISIDGPTSLATSANQLARFAAAGWDVDSADGHDPDDIARAISAARASDRPTMIAFKTIIGFGAPTKSGTAGAHGAPLGAAEVEAARERLGWRHPPFHIPDDIRAAWARAGQRSKAESRAWDARRAALHDDTGWEFGEALSGRLGTHLRDAFRAVSRRFEEEKPKIATRQASEVIIDAIAGAQHNLVGGSADLTHSNLTKAKMHRPVAAGDYSGRYIHYGVREHAMGAVMNGLALHGGFIPYGGTFLVFADFARPSIRLSALMGQRVIYVMTHDSIGLGEDGPTHQPIEHLASLRAMPNVQVFRPADAEETVAAWRCALETDDRPTVLCLSRQALPPIDRNLAGIGDATRGAYVAREATGRRQVTLLATGSEVSLAIAASEQLARENIAAAVISMPSWERFRDQPAEYRTAVLGTAPRIAIEAAARFGWDEWIGADGDFIGMNGFGASGPAADLYAHFGLTTEVIVTAARKTASRSEEN